MRYNFLLLQHPFNFIVSISNIVNCVSLDDVKQIYTDTSYDAYWQGRCVISASIALRLYFVNGRVYAGTFLAAALKV